MRPRRLALQQQRLGPGPLLRFAAAAQLMHPQGGANQYGHWES